MRTLRRWAAAVAAALVVVGTISGCSAVAAVDHVSSAAGAAAALAKTLRAAPGVLEAAARYNPADTNGEIVFVRVTFSTTASPTQWDAVAALITSGLTRTGLQNVRQKVRLTVDGASPARLDYGSLQDWQGRPSLATQVKRWAALRTSVGVPLRMDRSAETGSALVFRVASQVDSATFVRRIGTVAGQLDGVRVEGYGFSGFGPPPAKIDPVYRRMLATHPALDQNYSAHQHLPAAGLTWSQRSWRVTVVAPDGVAKPPVEDVALAGALQDLRARHVSGAFSWFTNATGASVVFSPCKKGHLTATPADRLFASALTRAGHPLATTGGPGYCR